MKKLFLLLISCIVIAVYAYSFTSNVAISGTITNDKGVPVPSVTISIDGTTSVAISDVSGRYQLSNVPETAVLNFMGYGLRSVQEKVNRRTVINIVLYPAIVTTTAQKEEVAAAPANAKGLKAKLNMLLSLGEELVRAASLVKTIKAEFKSPAKKINPVNPVVKPEVKDEEEEEDELIKKRISN